MEQLSLFIFYNFMFGTEKVICPKNSEGWMVGDWDSLNLDRSKLSWELFGLIQTFFYVYPNSIQTGGVVQFCHLISLNWDVKEIRFCGKCNCLMSNSRWVERCKQLLYFSKKIMKYWLGLREAGVSKSHFWSISILIKKLLKFY